MPDLDTIIFISIYQDNYLCVCIFVNISDEITRNTRRWYFSLTTKKKEINLYINRKKKQLIQRWIYRQYNAIYVRTYLQLSVEFSLLERTFIRIHISGKPFAWMVLRHVMSSWTGTRLPENLGTLGETFPLMI